MRGGTKVVQPWCHGHFKLLNLLRDAWHQAWRHLSVSGWFRLFRPSWPALMQPSARPRFKSRLMLPSSFFSPSRKISPLSMNPIVARTLMEGVAEAGEVHKWWSELKDGQIPLAPDLTRSDLEDAELIRSVRTANVPEGMLAVCGSERGTVTFFLRPNFAAAIACTVDKIGKRAEWWNPDYAVMPDTVSLN